MTIVIYIKLKLGKHHGKKTKKLFKSHLILFFHFCSWVDFECFGGDRKGTILYEWFFIQIVNYVKLLLKSW